MQFNKLVLIALGFFVSGNSYAQTNDPVLDSILSRPIPDQEIEEVVVIQRDAKSKAKLRHDVLKAYPYALRASSIIEQIDENTADIKKKKHKKRYLKKKEQQLKEEFEENLRQLTKTQGRYMIRMIQRETGTSVYDIVKEYKGGINATFWQLIAKKFESDLKSEFEANNPESIDYEIELILEDISPVYKQKYYEEVKIAPPSYRDFQ